MKTEQKTYARSEIVAAVAEVYRTERERHHRLAEQAQEAAQEGRAADYSRCDEEAAQQEKILKVVARVASALGIAETELAKAADRSGQKGGKK